MQWLAEFSAAERRQLLIMVALCVLFGVRYYPDNLFLTIRESVRYILAFFFYGGTLSFIMCKLVERATKRPISRKAILKFGLILALFFSITEALHVYFQLGPKKSP
ncbi:hypothetical protein G4V39_09280 [Thermosulfuriphilus ammonigenes]|uniref:Uncharacterized protein n=1 Tax=Thermosulfuriphilus ammonigenes TaxID=1936021 RepID=A0A6G7PXV7_9BACT|nr:hypothetical protein [Thermosulfuriphilus ammonigenes]MBA2849376.1 hypothetical protein [Thermosulfuriphilus ammonigenes]QIJ72450.1 hypothetical protein G4V39_09280 [Thermosulfuriphilus ammonigenes]HFB84128.1 hypothetical protein [Thermodesulfatator sp.]